MYTPSGPSYAVPYDGGELRGVLSAEVTARVAELSVRPLNPGTKSVIVLICRLARVFGAHEVGVALDLPDYVTKALVLLVEACAIIDDLNPPGPA